MSWPKDHISEEGARALAKRIRDYWKERGDAVTTSIVSTNVGAAGDGKGAVFGVRSNTLNGWPRP